MEKLTASMFSFNLAISGIAFILIFLILSKKADPALIKSALESVSTDSFAWDPI